ncbi:hypothetical protein [Micromonospora citrea]|uniref:hypothetical protein n=1 Tax=Micromonospora citrea TaxID=47855 RepID=UPI000B83EA61|nr:hypothetical protein [Micromonospora citrea]
MVGISAALLQGVELSAGDIDILVARRTDVDCIAAALSRFRYLHPPAWLPDARQYFAHYQSEQIGVSVSTVERPADAAALDTGARGTARTRLCTAASRRPDR